MRCFVCNRNQWVPHYPNLLMCQNCGFVRARDKFFRLKPQKVYGKNYYLKGQYADYENEAVALSQNFNERLAQITKFKKSGNLLDIGCAYGYFLLATKKKFKSMGIDLNKEVTKKAGQISDCPVVTGDFLGRNFGAQKFDTVTLFDSLEHLKNPKMAIAKIHRLLKKGGIIAIETGDIGSFLAKIQGSSWRLIDPKVHLSYFSKRTLIQLLTSNNFEILEMSYVPFRRTLRQFFYRLVGSKILLPFLPNISPKLNTYDIMFVIARKK